MEQTKNEPKNENKAASGNDKPKKERKPLTEAHRVLCVVSYGQRSVYYLP